MIYCDIAEPYQLGLQEPATAVMEGLIELHNNIMFYGIMICILIIITIYNIIENFKIKKNKISYKEIRHGTTIEIIWTIMPAIILILIALPSFKLLYLSDEVIDPVITVKAIGNQWYWQYEYTDYEGGKILFDSYMIPTDELKLGQFRLLEVDNRVILPINTPIRLILTARDVIHSWAVPSFGIKLDTVPGRLNQTGLLIKREGVYYGQCSELCGVNHGFMPIVVEAVSISSYISWILSNFDS